MENEDTTLRLPMFHGMDKDNVDQHWFTCKAIWYVKRITDEVSKITQLETTFRDRDVMWYMKYKETTSIGWTRSLTKIKRDLLREFHKAKSKS